MTSQTCLGCLDALPTDAQFCPRCGEPTPTRTGESGDGSAASASESAGEIDYRHRLARALGDDYELRNLIGRGGFGAVYRAWDKRLDRDVAVKALRHDLFPTPEVLHRFDREAKAVAKLRHPNILPVYAVGTGDGVAYMVMPLVEGESLQSCLDRQKVLPVAEAARITAEAAAALEAAHKLGFVHRDVKPANIMLEGEERRVLLMDFGIAKAAAGDDEALTAPGVIIGSPAYMSPEQSRGERDVDGRSDIYSLGAVAYELLSGVRPFTADSLHELVYKQVTEDVLDVAERVPDLPAHVGQSVMRCLAKDREHRWQTAADLRTSLSTSANISSRERHSEPDEESWLSLRGPYMLLLGFLLYFSEILARMMKIRSTAEFWFDDLTLFAYARNGVWVLLIAAAVDLAVRIAVRVSKGQSWSQVVRFLFGQPDWWQTWYPRPLRVRDSVWDRLTVGMKTLRTLAWLQCILLPFGGVLVLVVFPTFRALAVDSVSALPLSLRVFHALVVWGSYALIVTLALLLWQLRQARIRHNVPTLALLRSLLNLRGSYWQGSQARAVLRD